jgi:flagellar motor protein MotB
VRETTGEHGYLASVSDLMAVLFFLAMILLVVFILKAMPDGGTAADAAAAKARADALRAELAAMEADKVGFERERDSFERERDGFERERDGFEKKRAKLDREKSELEADRAILRQEEDRIRLINADLTDSRSIREEFIRHISESMRGRGGGEGFIVEADLKEGLFRFQSELLFPSGVADLNEGGQAALRALGKIMIRSLPCYAYADPYASGLPCLDPPEGGSKPGRFDVVLIEGHTDTVNLRPSSPFKDNMELSAARSRSTYKFLMDAEPCLAVFRNGDGQHLFGMSGFGEQRCVACNQDGEESWRRNRRVDFRIVLAAPRPDGAGPRPSPPPAAPLAASLMSSYEEACDDSLRGPSGAAPGPAVPRR